MKRFVAFFVLASLCLLAGTGIYNYVFDTSGLFNTDFSYRRVEPNQHFVKVRYLLERPQKYDAYCFGSSRVGNLDLTRIHDGHRYYNMTYSQGLPAEWLEDLRIFLRHGVAVKKVLLGIDDFSFQLAPGEHERQYLRIPYHDDGNFRTYLAFLFRRPAMPPGTEKGSIYDIYDTGRPLHAEADERIEQDPAAHVQDAKFREPAHYGGDRVAEAIAELREIKELCGANGIELVMFINPIHATTYRDNDIARFNAFKRQLATVADYWDFSGLNDITTDNYCYYETSHYRPLVGDKMLGRMFSAEGDDSFGVHVTQENIDAHIREMERQAGETE